MNRWGFRARLIGWHAIVTTILLFGAGVLADWFLRDTILGRVDSALISIAETEAGSSFDGPTGLHLHDVDRLPADDPRRADKLDKFVQVIDADGRVLLRSLSLGTDVLPVGPSARAALGANRMVIETATLGGRESVRLVTLPVQGPNGQRFAIQVGAPLRPTTEVMTTARTMIWARSALVLIGVVLTGALLARRALRPVARIAKDADEIGQNIGGRRLPHPGTDDELGGLVTTLNGMLDRLERSMETQRRFTADAAHELRSPLSRLRAELEIALRRTRSPEEYQAVLRSALDEAVRMTELSAALLTLARLDADGHAVAQSDGTGVPSDALAVAVARAQAAAGAREIRIAVGPVPSASVAVPPRLLELLLGNLIDNAVKFSPAGGEVRVSGRVDGRHASLSVSDRGPGIPPEQVGRLFERFSRIDPARSPDVPGVGLGLSICRAITDRCGGAIGVAENPGGGSVFTVTLPLAEPTT